jgi:hypothetical protein
MSENDILSNLSVVDSQLLIDSRCEYRSLVARLCVECWHKEDNVINISVEYPISPRENQIYCVYNVQKRCDQYCA